ncbi:MAG: multiprotein bridging factor aMBF1 [Candidatus Bathyarchaeota archaeon]|nr:multiprotein bridging factor aMBF1 [Candidatus Bathyarchaeota archaeon]
MRCEVCGRKIHENPNKVIIEGAKMTVCRECAKHGTTTWSEAPKPKVELQKPNLPSVVLTSNMGSIPIKKKVFQPKVDTTQEIVEDYGEVIRQAREKAGLSHEELGKKINEKESLLRKIETGKVAPNDLLVSKLEHILKIKLLVPVSEEKTPPKTTKVANELTLGDIIQFDKKNKGS